MQFLDRTFFSIVTDPLRLDLPEQKKLNFTLPSVHDRHFLRLNQIMNDSKTLSVIPGTHYYHCFLYKVKIYQEVNWLLGLWGLDFTLHGKADYYFPALFLMGMSIAKLPITFKNTVHILKHGIKKSIIVEKLSSWANV